MTSIAKRQLPNASKQDDAVSDGEGETTTPVKMTAEEKAKAKAFETDFSNLVCEYEPFVDLSIGYVPDINKPPTQKANHARVIWCEKNLNKDYDAFKISQALRNEDGSLVMPLVEHKNGKMVTEDKTYQTHPSYLAAKARFDLSFAAVNRMKLAWAAEFKDAAEERAAAKKESSVKRAEKLKLRNENKAAGESGSKRQRTIDNAPMVHAVMLASNDIVAYVNSTLTALSKNMLPAAEA